MQFYESGNALATDMGIPVSTLEQTHEGHYIAAHKPEGGPWPGYPSGTSWDHASGPTGSGKTFYTNAISGSQVATEPFLVAIITPVIHYTLGGVEINKEAQCLDDDGIIPGLFAAGEVTGGVHGNHRLGGNALLECVVFGRICGREAAKYMLGSDGMSNISLKKLRNSPEPSKSQQLAPTLLTSAARVLKPEALPESATASAPPSVDNRPVWLIAARSFYAAGVLMSVRFCAWLCR